MTFSKGRFTSHHNKEGRSSISKYGEMLIDFLRDSKCCVIDGRVGHDDFTLVYVKGKSVVDYITVPHESMNNRVNFCVLSRDELIKCFK